jgi:transcriptional regulator with XRE-family HTH domain
MSVSKRIFELRHALNLTQPKFAEKICISKGYIASLELGKKTVNDRIIRLICTAFNVSETWLRTGEGAMFLDPQTRKVEEIVKIFRNLNPFFQDYFLFQMQQIYEYEKAQGKTREE